MPYNPLKRRFYPPGGQGDVEREIGELKADPSRRKAALKLMIDIQTTAACWPFPPGVDSRPLRGWEPLKEIRRTACGIACRVFFFVKGDESWVLSMYEKSSQDAPRRELERAFRRLRAIQEET